MAPDFEHIADFAALRRAAWRAGRGKHDRPAVARFLMDLEPEALRLERGLRDNTWRPGAYRTFWINRPKRRLISAASFADRVVHHALCAQLDPVLERQAIDDSFACRRDKGPQRAVQRVQHFARRFEFALRLDVRSFFASIDHARLRRLLNTQVEDARIQRLIGHVVENGPPGAQPGHGLPVGNLTSQYVANAYLTVLDRVIKQDLRARGYVRYMDDMVLFADEKADLWAWHAAIEACLRDRLGLRLRPDATRLGPVRDGVAFLGFRIWPNLIRMSPGNLRRWRAKMRQACRAVDAGHMAADDAIRVVAGLEGWAQHANTRQLRRAFFNRRAT